MICVMESMTPTPLYRVIIAGSRDFSDYSLMCEHCDKFLSQKKQTHSIVIVSGAARGTHMNGDMPLRDTLLTGSGTARLQAPSETLRWQRWPMP